MTILSVQNLGKAYRSYRNEWIRFAGWFGFPVRPSSESWVLRHINLSVCEGEAVAIIGENGAGKSTLLKLITGTVQPTEGVVNLIGRAAAILELGMGFNPEMTGRQNVRHSAGLMGLTADEIASAIDDIEEFAEVGEYFDQPVRNYSSGMQMRVAFAVATAKRPEMLIVDEALSVGDAYFQHKSFERIRQFQAQGTTLLFVSHDPGSVKALCNRAVLLEKGAILKDGTPEEVLDFYNALVAEKDGNTIQQRKLSNGRVATSSGTGEAKVADISLEDEVGRRVEVVSVGQKVTLRIIVEVFRDIPRLVLGYGIRDRLGQVIFGTNTQLKNQVLHDVVAGQRLNFEISFPVNLGPGSYSIQTALVSSETHMENNYEWRDLAHVFKVVNTDREYFAGCAWIDTEIEVN